MLSEVFRICLLVPANSATESELLSIIWVLAFERALIGTRALRQLALGLSRNIVSIDLSLVAGLTEVGVTPAEPLGDRATELALELYKVCAMLRTIDYTCTHTHC